MQNRHPPPFCDALQCAPNKTMADWIVPYVAKFTNPRNIHLCSQITSLMSGQTQFQIDIMKKNIPTLLHLSRLKGMQTISKIILFSICNFNKWASPKCM